MIVGVSEGIDDGVWVGVVVCVGLEVNVVLGLGEAVIEGVDETYTVDASVVIGDGAESRLQAVNNVAVRNRIHILRLIQGNNFIPKFYLETNIGAGLVISEFIPMA